MEHSLIFSDIQGKNGGMRFIFTLIFSLFFVTISFAQNTVFEGTWKGVILRKGQTIQQGTVLYAQFDVNGSSISGYTREESFDSPYFSVKKLSGNAEGGQLSFSHIVEVKSKKTGRMKWCRFEAKLQYDVKKGYLKGEYVSTDCRNVIGNMVLYREQFELGTGDEMDMSHMWFTQFIKDYNEGLSAPEIRKMERDNFVFEPIFFDYDKFEIRETHHEFLNRMIKIVKGHSDLRVKVTGHTDSDGSHQYNDTLSYNRAQAIIAYFVAHGLSKDRLVIDFKGEKSPASTNSTSEGRQRNRRVDFEFI